MGSRRWVAAWLVVAGWASAEGGADDDLASAFGPQKELKVFEPERNVLPPPPPEDPNAGLRESFETDLAGAQQLLDQGQAAEAREALATLELNAFVLGGPQRVRVQQLAHAVALALDDQKALPAIDEKWLTACGPEDVERCRDEALASIAHFDPAFAGKVRAADGCLLVAERAAGHKAPGCLAAARALYLKADDALMFTRVDLVNALALAADPKQVKAAKKALTKIGEFVTGRNAVVRRQAYDARAKLELGEGHVEDAAKSALLGAEAWASGLEPSRRYWARSPMVDEACAAYDQVKGADACRALEKSIVGHYVFHDFSTLHLPDRQPITHELLVEVNAHYGILIKDCLAHEVRAIADKAQTSYLVQWLVIGSGHVDNFHSLSTEQDQSRFVRCLREQFGFWRYPSHDSSPLRIQQGFSVKSRVRSTEKEEEWQGDGEP